MSGRKEDAFRLVESQLRMCEMARSDMRKKARWEKADLGRQYAQEEMRRLLHEVESLRAGVLNLGADAQTGAPLLAELDGEADLLRQMIEYPLFSQEADDLIAYAKQCGKQAGRTKAALKKLYKKIAKEEQRQAKSAGHEQTDREEAWAEEAARLEQMEREAQLAQEAELARLKREADRQEALYLQEMRRQETEYLQAKLIESMEEMGCRCIAKKDTDSEYREQLFSYADGCAVHVIESGGQTSMEIVGMDYDEHPADVEEAAYIRGQMETFEAVYDEFLERMGQKGIIPKDGCGLRIPASCCHPRIVNLNDYRLAEDLSGGTGEVEETARQEAVPAHAAYGKVDVASDQKKKKKTQKAMMRHS